MIKNITLLSVLLFSPLPAQMVESEIGVNIGLNSTKNEDSNKFENPRIGLTYQNDRYIVMPRVDLEYVHIKDDYASSLLKGSVNGVYEYENKTNTTPYALAGIGYEFVQGGTKDIFESHPFIQAGAGLRFDLDKGYKARIEGKMLKIIGGNNEGNEAMVTAGVSFPFSYGKVPVKPRVSRPKVPRPRPRIVRPPIPQPRVIRQVQPIVRIQPVYINNNECTIKTSLPDLDRDGIEDSRDQCPATPCDFSVDNYGCPIKTTLRINFRINSANIEPDSQFKVNNFANFLLQNKGSFIRIIGHTDSVGTVEHNMALSLKRANSVVQALIHRGVSFSRLRAEGRGESMPIASNETSQGKALNRRIEANMSYPKRRR